MTTAPPDISVDHSALWVSVNSGQDVEAWAPTAARDAWRASGLPFSDLDVDRLAAQLSALAQAAFRTECFGAFVLVPDPVAGPVATVRANGMTYPSGTPFDDLLAQLLLPPELLLLPAQVEHLAVRGRSVVRIRQRAIGERTRAVADYLTYVLPFDGAAWLLSASFPDPAVADQWLPALDELAAAVEPS